MPLYRKVIRITAEDSPNVRYAKALRAQGRKEEAATSVLYPGVLPYRDYAKRRKTWDRIRQTIGLDARFYEGASVLMYPPDWLDAAERLAVLLENGKVGPSGRIAKSMGIDPAEGGDSSTWTVVDEWGILDQLSMKTPDTTVIIDETIRMGTRWRVPPEKWMFDRGGGKQHADTLRKRGYPVQTIGFGESVLLEPRAGRNPLTMRKDIVEERYAYMNRRAQMYGELRILLDPASAGPVKEGGNGHGFAIPARFAELRRQLAVIPLLYDAESRMKMLPKNKRSAESKEMTLTQLIGHSPDEADSTVLAVHGMLHKHFRAKVGGG